MRELFRVLKPGGWALLQSPIDPGRAVTYEDPPIVSPEARLKAYGQRDHVRIYGTDYADRLQDAGFEVKVIDYLAQLPPATIKTYGLNTPEQIYRCSKAR